WALLENVLAAAGREEQAAPVRRIAALELIGRVLGADYVAWLDREENGEWQCTQEGVADPANATDLRSAVVLAAAKITNDSRSVCQALDASRNVIINHLVLPTGSESLLAAVCNRSLE